MQLAWSRFDIFHGPSARLAWFSRDDQFKVTGSIVHRMEQGSPRRLVPEPITQGRQVLPLVPNGTTPAIQLSNILPTHEDILFESFVPAFIIFYT